MLVLCITCTSSLAWPPSSLSCRSPQRCFHVLFCPAILQTLSPPFSIFPRLIAATHKDALLNFPFLSVCPSIHSSGFLPSFRVITGQAVPSVQHPIARDLHSSCISPREYISNSGSLPPISLFYSTGDKARSSHTAGRCCTTQL